MRQCVNLPSYSVSKASCLSCFRVPFDLPCTQAQALTSLLSQKSFSIMSSPSQLAAPSSNFKSMLDTALAEYKKKTGNDLLAHWLAAELQTCESVDAVLDILRDQAKAFERSGDQRVMRWIDPLVHVLYTFSGALGDGVSLVFIQYVKSRSEF